MNKKAQAITFDNAPRIVLLFVLIGMILGAGMIALSSFRDNAFRTVTQTNNFTGVLNTLVAFAGSDAVVCSGAAFTHENGSTVTDNYAIVGCQANLTAVGAASNLTVASYTATIGTEAQSALNDTLEGGVNLSEQLPTVGTMLGVGLILVVVIGIFAFFALRQG